MTPESLAEALERILAEERDAIRRLLSRGPDDPFAYKFAATKKRPPQRSGAIAVNEPDHLDHD